MLVSNLKDLDIGSQKILSFHALLPRHGSNKERGIDVLEIIKKSSEENFNEGRVLPNYIAAQ